MKNITLNNLKTIVLLCCCLFGSNIVLHAQDLDWVKQIGGPNADDGRVIRMDAAGNIYVAGRFKGSVDFDPNAGVQTLTATGTNFNSYILKLTATGDFLWVKQLAGSGNEPGKMTVDTAGNIYLTGGIAYNGVIDVDPGPGVFNLTGTGGSVQNADFWIMKLNTNGGLEWAKQLGGPLRDRSSAIAVDKTGNVYTIGNFLGTVDFNPGSGVNNLTSVNISSNRGDIFISKLDADGNYVWAKQFGAAAPNMINANDMEMDDYGNIYIAGTFQGTIDFDPGAGISALTVDMLSMYVSKLNSDGNFLWAKNTLRSATGIGVVGSIVLDKFNHLYLSGTFNDTVDVNPGNDTFNLVSTLTGVDDIDVFVSKLDTAGGFIWAKSFGSISVDESGVKPVSDNYGNVLIMGRYRAVVDFDPSLTGVFELVPSGPQGDIFLSKLDSAGAFVWAISFGNPSSSLGSNALNFKTHPVSNRIYITGDFSNTTDFDPGTDTFDLIANPGGGDAFILRLNNCSPLSSTISTTACDSFSLNGTTYNLSGTYTQAFVTQNGCDSTLTLQLIINSKPDATVTQAGATLTSNTAAATYQWINCNNGNSIIPGAISQTYTATVGGSYAVIITKNGCSDTSDCHSISITDINDLKTEGNFTVFPNPVKGLLTVSSTNTLYNAHLKLADIAGRVISTWSGISGNHVQLDLSRFAPGIYILEVNGGRGVSRIKVVKE